MDAPWYTWVFSGIGVLGLTALAAIFSRWKKKHREPRAYGAPVGVSAGRDMIGSPIAYGRDIIQNVNISTPASVQSDYQETPTPEEIRKSLHTLTAFQQIGARDSYRNIRVRWLLYLHSLSPHAVDAGHYLVMFRSTYGQAELMVTCSIRIEEFPRLQLANIGDRIVVRGVINKIDLFIELRDVHLDFPGSQKLGQIAFDLDRSFREQGWKVAGATGPNAAAFETAPEYIGGIHIQAEPSWAMDYTLPPEYSQSDRIRFRANFEPLSHVYAKVGLWAAQGAVTKTGWIACSIGTKDGYEVSEVEWGICRKAGSNGWAEFDLSLSEEVEKSHFARVQGFHYKQLLGIRIRGSVSVTPIEIYKQH